MIIVPSIPDHSATASTEKTIWHMIFVMRQVLSDLDELHGCHSGHELLSYLRLMSSEKAG